MSTLRPVEYPPIDQKKWGKNFFKEKKQLEDLIKKHKEQQTKKFGEKS